MDRISEKDTETTSLEERDDRSQDDPVTVTVHSENDSAGDDDEERSGSPNAKRGKAKRTRYTLSFRKECLDHLDKLKASGHKCVVMKTAE